MVPMVRGWAVSSVGSVGEYQGDVEGWIIFWLSIFDIWLLTSLKTCGYLYNLEEIGFGEVVISCVTTSVQDKLKIILQKQSMSKNSLWEKW